MALSFKPIRVLNESVESLSLCKSVIQTTSGSDNYKYLQPMSFNPSKKQQATIILFLLLGILMHAYSQTHEPQFKLITGVDGIALGKINNITRDIHGVTWLSDQTNRGIVRYDGTHMTRFVHDTKNPNSLGEIGRAHV